MQLNSENKTIIIFSDPHQEIDKLEFILKKENYDIAVCLGDWFDSFDYNSEYDLEKTCRFLKKWLFKENFISLEGNHDTHYLWGNPSTRCSGYYSWKDKFITNYFKEDFSAIRDKLKWYFFIDDFLCTHAGLHPNFLPINQVLNKRNLSDWLDNQIKEAKIYLAANGTHWTYRAGQARGGSQKFGGLTWLDADVEAEPIEGLKQLYGHSSHSRILKHKDQDGLLDINDCSDICIDCHLSEYLLIQNGKLKINKITDL